MERVEKGHMQKIFLKGRECCLALPRDRRKYPLLAVICGANEELLQELAKRFPHMLLFAPSIQWERDFTPWPAPGLSAETPFLGEASAYLSFLEQEALPFLEKNYLVQSTAKTKALVGYSLGGLFAAWAIYQSAAFGCCASVSGSLWYDGFLDFAASHRPMAKSAYLSLGKGEERTRNRRMRIVGECTRAFAGILQGQLGAAHVYLEWNPGGHASEIPMRISKALAFFEENIERK